MLVLGVDIGGTSFKAGLVNEKGQILYRFTYLVKKGLKQEETLKEFLALCVEELRKHPEYTPLSGVGLGVPGSINALKGSCDYSNNLGWENFMIAKMVSETLHLPTYIDNDANAALLGEVKFTSSAKYKNIVFLTLGTGIGSGLYLDGKIYRGNEGKGAELGHTLIALDGKTCSCGRKGCLEAYASATALKRETKEAMEAHKESSLWNLCDYSLDNVRGSTPFKGARAGDKTSQEVIANYIKYLGEGCLNFINAFRPEAIILGGGVSKAGDALLNPLKEYLEARDYGFGGKHAPKVDILLSSLGNDAGILGAASLALKEDKGYLLNLRQEVGHRPLVVAFSAVIILNEKNEILLEERQDDLMLDIPGGSIELHEKAEEAAIREVQEETGLTIKDLTLFHVYSGDLGYYKYKNGDEVCGVDIIYLTKIKEAPMQREATEVNALKWYQLEAIPANRLSPRNQDILKRLKEHLLNQK